MGDEYNELASAINNEEADEITAAATELDRVLRLASASNSFDAPTLLYQLLEENRAAVAGEEEFRAAVVAGQKVSRVVLDRR